MVPGLRKTRQRASFPRAGPRQIFATDFKTRTSGSALKFVERHIVDSIARCHSLQVSDRHRHAEIEPESLEIVVCRSVGIVPSILGLVWLRVRPKSGSKSKMSGGIFKDFRGPSSSAETATTTTTTSSATQMRRQFNSFGRGRLVGRGIGAVRSPDLWSLERPPDVVEWPSLCFLNVSRA